MFNIQRYQYSIFDHGEDPWPDCNGRPFCATSDTDAARYVQRRLIKATKNLREADGYAVGDKICARVWDARGILVTTLMVMAVGVE